MLKFDQLISYNAGMSIQKNINWPMTDSNEYGKLPISQQSDDLQCKQMNGLTDEINR